MSELDVDALRAKISATLDRIADAGIKRSILGDRQTDFLTPEELLKAWERINQLSINDGSVSSTTYIDGAALP